jgi:hypothetical protein
MRKSPAILAFLLLAACGSKSAPATTTTTTTDEQPPPEEEVVVPEGMKFDDMSLEQRKAFMKQTVVPTMKPLFQAFDPDKFAEFNCKTCHGGGAEDGSFEMPDPAIDRLPPPDQFMAFAQEPEHAPWVKFMAEEVKPTMARLLQETEFDPATGTGEFSCGNCHMTEGQ